jgi:hypothetical protein
MDYEIRISPIPKLSTLLEFNSRTAACVYVFGIGKRFHTGDIFIFFNRNFILMINAKMMALVVMAALIGFGAATLAIPLITEVSAQDNMTGNMTGNATEMDSDTSGNISGLLATP